MDDNSRADVGFFLFFLADFLIKKKKGATSVIFSVRELKHFCLSHAAFHLFVIQISKDGMVTENQEETLQCIKTNRAVIYCDNMHLRISV